VIEKGRRNVEILKQPQHQPMPVEEQVAIIFVGTKNLLRNVPVEKVKEFEKDYLEFLRMRHRDILDRIKKGEWNDEIAEVLTRVAKEIAAAYEVKEQ
jgi:F-type H+-transporting ATPase subunit alpha